MDALINTFKPSALPPELINMHRETRERSKNPRFNSRNLLLAVAPHPFPSAIPTPASTASATASTSTSTSSSSAAAAAPSKNINAINLNLNLSLLQPQPVRYLSPTSPDQHPIHHSKLPIPSSSRSHANLSASTHQGQPLSSSQRPATSHQSSSGRKPPPVPAIPSIHQIIQKYSSQLNQSSIPLKSSSSLLRKTNPQSISSDPPPLRPSTTHQFYHRHDHPPRSNYLKSDFHSQPYVSSSLPTRQKNPSNLSMKKSRLASQTQPETFSDDESTYSTSSIHSLTREALKLPQLPALNFDSSTFQINSQSPPSFDPQPSNHSQKQKQDSDSISKRSKVTRSSTHDTAPPCPKTCSQAEIDDHIAQYLRSSRLTTLIKLERQQSPMTVSLADVGSSTGHPVIVYLGLGCVRYLVGLYDELAEALGLRLICIDRWGLGKTTEVPDDQRSFTEWASVVEEVVDQLGIEKFSILAHSAGAPYALASSLRFVDRVHGSIHLLAPWVSMTAEGGMDAGAYKWLRYIPNSMIKTVQTAEWKMTGWRLGKLPKLNYPPVGFDARSPTPSTSPNQSSSNKTASIHSDSSIDPQNPKNNFPQLLSSRSKTPTCGSSRGTNNYSYRTLKDNHKIKGVIPTSSTTATNSNSARRRMSDHLEMCHVSGQIVDDLDSLIDQPDRVLLEIEKKKSLILTSNNYHNAISKKKTLKSSQGSSRQKNNEQHLKQSSTCSSTATVTTSNKMKTRKNSQDSRSDGLSHSFDYSSDSHSFSGSMTAKPNTDLTCVASSSTSTNSNSHRSNSIVRKSIKNDAQVHSMMEKTSSTDSAPPGIQKQRKTKNSTSSSINSQNGVMGTLKSPSSSNNKEVVGEGIGGIKRTLGISLLRASYSESLKGGASDLITILEKDTKKKPWGFKYSEIIKPVKIWHGDKDEKLSYKGSEIFLNSILINSVKDSSRLFIVKDANHSLMTNVNVLFQVFESISDEWSPSFSSPF